MFLVKNTGRSTCKRDWFHAKLPKLHHTNSLSGILAPSVTFHPGCTTKELSLSAQWRAENGVNFSFLVKYPFK